MELSIRNIEDGIFTVRGIQVMLDSDLAVLYQTETKVINRAVKRNPLRFPEAFMFQLTEKEWTDLKFQFGTSSEHGGRRTLPYVFTEQGVAMLSAVLNTERAISASVQIMQAFVAMRKFLLNNASVFQRLDQVELKQLKTDVKLEQIFKALEAGKIKPSQGIFFDGQIFDAYVFASDLIKKAKNELILIDNYIDETTITHLAKKAKKVKVLLYTKTTSKQLLLDIKKANEQYDNSFELKELKNSHDRFLILDGKELYHIGASLKDLGKKWFAFSKMEDSMLHLILEQLKKEKL
ncbi:MAG: ORF6N domain-containing protein [Candidatus Cyclonatronum sp.]|uniref:ORF6N domain-containing protein n=1 Tax=Cyclonatronum sp. TaxID=3024185 RepID=UPI0025C6BD9B|nr:ORF6N domain-containing protein [Cyclonatronum sp.]MCH8485765.1 ORF6N domain-containing protein [Cyclonatronum sp.]